MKPIFSRGPSLQIRLVLAVVLVLLLIIADNRWSAFRQVREYLDTAVSPFYFIANIPQKMLDSLSQSLDSRKKLEQENQALRQELLLKNSDLLLLGQYKQENAMLRELLSSPLRQDEQKKVARVIATAHNPYADQVVIDKGSANGVYESQPVIDDKGVVGQVVAVAKYTSRVLLICDSTHALPVQVLRNDIRAIAAGNGCSDDLTLEHLPASIDIRPGDVLVTSGLGGVFPEGYPVATVSAVQVDHQRAWTVVKAHPTAGFQRLRYLLLLWNDDKKNQPPMSAQQVHQVAEERLQQMLPQVLTSPEMTGTADHKPAIKQAAPAAVPQPTPQPTTKPTKKPSPQPTTRPTTKPTKKTSPTATPMPKPTATPTPTTQMTATPTATPPTTAAPPKPVTAPKPTPKPNAASAKANSGRRHEQPGQNRGQ